MDCSTPGFPCPSLSPGVCSNSCSLSRWCHPNYLTLCLPFFLLSSTFSSIRVFSNELVLPIRWPKYWSFSISEYSRLISFRIDWFDLLAVPGALNSLIQDHNLKVSNRKWLNQRKRLWVAPYCSQVWQKFWVTWGPTCHLISVCVCVCVCVSLCVRGGARGSGLWD